MASAETRLADVSGHRGVFARVGRNLRWLAGSTAFSAVTSISYVALAARVLGPAGFGTYAVILTFAQLIGNVVQFQSWNGLIRYGSVHLARDNTVPLARLFGFTAMLDWASGLAGLLLAVVLVPIVGPYLHWSSAEMGYAAWFSAAFLLTTGSTATGILRLFDRFDLLVYSDGIGPMTRIVGAIIGWIVAGGVRWFLAVWFLAAALQLLAQWVAALSLGHRVALSLTSFRRAAAENRRIWRFMLKTNLSTSIRQFGLQCGTLVVGWVAGPVEAGGFRIAQRFAQALTKPVDMITKALFPEFARLIAVEDHATARKVLARITLVASSFAAIVVLITGLAGTQILHVIAGRRFEFAQPFFFLLAIASAVDLAGFALGPFHNAHGRAGRVLRSGLVGLIVYAVLLAAFLPTVGARGAAYAAIGGSLTIFVQLLVSCGQILRKVDPLPANAGAMDVEFLEELPGERELL